MTVRPGVAERLSRMVQLPTVSAELDRRGLDDFDRFRELLVELYPLVHQNLALERVTDLGLLYRWRGTGDDDPVVLMGHFDVVPAGDDDGWTFPPYEGRIHDGSVWGRGTLDDKGPLLVILEAVENLLADGFVPERDVYLSFGGDEEVRTVQWSLAPSEDPSAEETVSITGGDEDTWTFEGGWHADLPECGGGTIAAEAAQG